MIPIHREGRPFIGLFALAALLLFYVAEPLGWIGVVLTAWCTYFFRNPDRTTPTRPGLVISPADGLVQMIQDAAPPPIAYHPGKFLNAALDKASLDNERNSFRLVLPDGRDVAVVQIAGLVARRIKCWIVAKQALRAGERFGIIRFGSRVDVYLPLGTPVMACVGQRAVAGETVLADLGSGVQEPSRTGEVR
ncbi:MAG: phosphatidylserine decarboxylase [Phycisphaerae bacterium]|nr:phosphatidylserine decarboxylase [Phycisphaerae bacterium]